MNSPLPPAADTPSPDPATTPTRPASTKRRRKATGALEGPAAIANMVASGFGQWTPGAKTFCR